MHITKALRAAHRTPLIKFIGKRSPPQAVDHTPSLHPASPTDSLPDSFANYRSKAQQHGPLGVRSSSSPSPQSAPTPAQSQYLAYGPIGGHSGRSLGPVAAPEGFYFDRSELPERFGRTPWSQAEIDAIETGGASMWG